MQCYTDTLNISPSDENRRKYRQLLFSCPAPRISPISAVILFHDTLYQKADDGTPFIEMIRERGIIPGIKVSHKHSILQDSWILPLSAGGQGSKGVVRV